MREFLRCAAACRGSRTTTDAFLRRGRPNGATSVSGTRFDALSSNDLNASESDYTAKKNPNPRSYDGCTQACLFDCLHANEAYARCEACSPIFALYDRRSALGGLNIRAHQPHTINDRGKPRFFRKAGDQECSECADPTLCLPECRTGLTSACATYRISVKEPGRPSQGDAGNWGIAASIAISALTLPRSRSHCMPARARRRCARPLPSRLKILFPSDERNLEVRIQEALVAIWLEWRLSKG